jgi:HPt (histidine-containing phosphotransfer) domain-containing protein
MQPEIQETKTQNHRELYELLHLLEQEAAESKAEAAEQQDARDLQKGENQRKVRETIERLKKALQATRIREAQRAEEEWIEACITIHQAFKITNHIPSIFISVDVMEACWVGLDNLHSARQRWVMRDDDQAPARRIRKIANDLREAVDNRKQSWFSRIKTANVLENTTQGFENLITDMIEQHRRGSQQPIKPGWEMYIRTQSQRIEKMRRQEERDHQRDAGDIDHKICFAGKF